MTRLRCWTLRAACRVRLAAALLLGAGCPSTTPTPAAPAPPPVCTVTTNALAAPSVTGSEPALAAAAATAPAGTSTVERTRFAMAWLEFGDHQTIRAAVVDDAAQPIADPVDSAPGWTELGPPELVANTGGFTLVFSGREPRGQEGVATAALHLDGTIGPPQLIVPAPEARVLAAADTGSVLLVAWYPWSGDPALLHLTAIPRGGGASRTDVLGRTPFEPSMELVPVADRVRAVWAAQDRAPQTDDPLDEVYLGTLDPEGRILGSARLGLGLFPSLAPVQGGELVLMERRPHGTLWMGLVAPGAASSPATTRSSPPTDERVLPESARLGAVARRTGGATVCLSFASPTADGDEIRCTLLDPQARPLETVGVAGGITGLGGIALTTHGPTTALAWQQEDGGGAVGVALLHCPPSP